MINALYIEKFCQLRRNFTLDNVIVVWNSFVAEQKLKLIE